MRPDPEETLEDVFICKRIMLMFFREEWELEGLQTFGVLLVVGSSLRLLLFLGIIDFTDKGKMKRRAL